MANFSQSSAPDTMEQQKPEASNYNRYQEVLQQTFENIRSGRLVEAGGSLLGISEWLLGHAAELGLIHDNQGSYRERSKIWYEFNMCWLALLQRQKEDTQKMLDSGQPPFLPQSILRLEALDSLGFKLICLDNEMEKHGLVDYQMGVWEEEILSMVIQCSELLEESSLSPDDEGVLHL